MGQVSAEILVPTELRHVIAEHWNPKEIGYVTTTTWNPKEMRYVTAGNWNAKQNITRYCKELESYRIGTCNCREME
jgi:hypothetical protein